MEEKNNYRKIAEEIMQKHTDPHCLRIKGCYEAVLDAMEEYAEKRLALLGVVGQSEQFYCTCSRAKGLDHDEEGMPYCIECQKPVQ